MKAFSKHWKSSVKPAKQRKYRINAPLHIKQKLVRAHLSKVLREKYGKRTAGLRVGDKVKVVRGEYSKREEKVANVDLKKGRIQIDGIERTKKDGSKVAIPINPSNVIIIEINNEDKKRKTTLERKTK
ncbi:MAG: 50S ribosomal protein L24 [Nanoarchaeota archaeon]|nr:50S ribosomal protein L24 [Nanoarchaeota archaeon]